MAQAAATPKSVFNGTAIAAARSVSRIADHASGSTIAAMQASQPLRSASLKTTASGMRRKMPTKPSASAVNA